MNDTDFANRYMLIRNTLKGGSDKSRFRDGLLGTSYAIAQYARAVNSGEPYSSRYLPENLKDKDLKGKDVPLPLADLEKMRKYFSEEAGSGEAPSEAMRMVGRVRAWREGRASKVA